MWWRKCLRKYIDESFGFSMILPACKGLEGSTSLSEALQRLQEKATPQHRKWLMKVLCFNLFQNSVGWISFMCEMTPFSLAKGSVCTWWCPFEWVPLWGSKDMTISQLITWKTAQLHVSNEKSLKKTGCLGHIGDCATQLCGDYDASL